MEHMMQVKYKVICEFMGYPNDFERFNYDSDSYRFLVILEIPTDFY